MLYDEEPVMAQVAESGSLQKIPPEQWDLPAGYDESGTRTVTLRELSEGSGKFRDFTRLTKGQLRELVARRIEAQAAFEVLMIGGGVVDKARAIREVRENSKVGQTLVEIEEILLKWMMDALAEGGKPDE